MATTSVSTTTATFIVINDNWKVKLHERGSQPSNVPIKASNHVTTRDGIGFLRKRFENTTFKTTRVH